jgi:hypothetical protein
MAIPAPTLTVLAMVDKLKRSLENLDPPECPQCHVEMNWFESKLIKPEPSAVIEHQFACDTCGAMRKHREEVDAGNGAGNKGSDRLPAGRSRWPAPPDRSAIEIGYQSLRNINAKPPFFLHQRERQHAENRSRAIGTDVPEGGV